LNTPDSMDKKNKKIINQKELAKIIFDKYKIKNLSKKEIEDLFKVFTDEIIEKLKENISVKITSFGTFSVKTRYSRGGVNPRNPEERIKIPEVKVAKFKTGKKLRDALK